MLRRLSHASRCIGVDMAHLLPEHGQLWINDWQSAVERLQHRTMEPWVPRLLSHTGDLVGPHTDQEDDQ